MSFAKQSVVSSLFGAEGARFRSTEWPTEPVVCRVDPEWFANLAALELVHDPERWLDCAPTLRSFRTGLLTRSEARRRYAEGESIYILRLEQTVAPLRELCARLAREIAIAESSITVEAWAAGGPTKVDMHFDLDTAFNIQVVGSKQWWTAPNASLQHPLHSHHVCQGNVIAASGKSAPTRMPDDARTWRAEPGHVAYVPQGVWHATETTEATFAFAFSIKTPTWAEHVSEVLLARLHAEPRWRARVLGSREPAHRERLKAAASDAIAASARLLAALSPAEVLHVGAWGGAPELFERADGVTDARIERADGGGRLTWRLAGEQAELAVPRWAMSAVEFVVQAERPWSIPAVHEQGLAEDEHLLGIVVLEMVRAGFLQKAFR
jgi:ribosomal protein L16 Arg81 hydroxylase